MGEHLLCKQGVVGSIPSASTKQMSEDREGISCEFSVSCPLDSGCSLTIWKKVMCSFDENGRIMG